MLEELCTIAYLLLLAIGGGDMFRAGTPVSKSGISKDFVMLG